MAEIPKEPQDWLMLFRQQIREIFSYLASLESTEGLGEGDCLPPMDMFETAEAFVIEVDLPGFAPEDISASICCSMLVIEGTKHFDLPPQPGRYICLERRFGRFCRTVEIPPAVDRNGVSSRFVRGVLVVTLPKLSDNNGIIREIPIE